MANSLHKRLMSERGASLSFALFLVLVCAAVSSIVLAAATASAGQFAELGKYDQRYYSVTSAAGLFRDSLDADGKVKYQYIQTREVTKRVEDPSDIGAVDFTEVTISPVTRVTSSSLSYDFIKDITSIIAYGMTYGKNPVTVGTVERSTFFEPFEGFSGTETISYTITPQITGSSTTQPVYAKGSIGTDWMLDINFANYSDSGSVNAAESYDLLLSLQGSHSSPIIEQDVEILSTEATTSAIGEVTVEYVVKVKETRTDTVVWQLSRLVSGGKS